MSDDRAVEQWLRRLGWALGRLSASERDDIVRETRTHMEERIAAGRQPATVLADFGLADRYARQFIDEMETYEALGSQRTGDLVRVVTARAHRNAIAAATLLGMLILAITAMAAMLLMMLKIYDPVHTGVWAGPHLFFLGVIDDPSSARETLGLWLFPLAVLLLLIAWVAGRALLSFAVPRLLPNFASPDRPSDRKSEQ